MRSSRSRSGSRPKPAALLASLALHAALFAALARVPRGGTRAAAAIGFEAEIAVAWVTSLEVDEEALPEPAPLVDSRAAPPPSFDLQIPATTEIEFEPPRIDFGDLENDPSFSELPVFDESPSEPPRPRPSDWMEPRLADCRLPTRPSQAKELELPDAAAATSGGPVAANPSGRVLSAVARSHGNAAPDYPREARRKGIEGVVLLRVAIAADGSCSNVTVQTSSGCEALDAAAVAAVRKWRFEPALSDGIAVASELLVPIRFVLKAGGAG